MLIPRKVRSVVDCSHSPCQKEPYADRLAAHFDGYVKLLHGQGALVLSPAWNPLGDCVQSAGLVSGARRGGYGGKRQNEI